VEPAPVPEELVFRILASRRDAGAGLVHLLVGIAVSPLLAVSLGL